MKLSMWIIKDWLSSYQPVATITGGEMSIETIHLVSQNTKPEQATLLIGQMKDFFEASATDEILLINGNDVISLRTVAIADIFNAISDAFAYYNRWEMKLLLDAGEENPEQQIIDDCHDIFGPMLLLDMEMQKIAMSQEYGIGMVNRVWDLLLTHDASILDTLENLRNTWFFENYPRIHQNSVFDLKDFADIMPYCHGIMLSQVNESGDLVAQMIICHVEPYPTSKVHLSTVVTQALARIKTKKTGFNQVKIVSNFFLLMLEDRENVNKYKQSIYFYNGWSQDECYCIAVMRKKNYDTRTNVKPVLALLQTNIQHSILVQTGDFIYSCINISKNSRYQDQITTICRQNHFDCGLSYIFEGLNRLFYMKMQGLDALNRNTRFFSDIAYSALFSHLEDPGFTEASIHPGILRLKNYDAANQTPFFDTLRVYLQSERNWVETAKKLYVHRNTVIFRIEKILSLLNLNLDESEAREYLLFSYRLMENRLKSLPPPEI